MPTPTPRPRLVERIKTFSDTQLDTWQATVALLQDVVNLGKTDALRRSYFCTAIVELAEIAQAAPARRENLLKAASVVSEGAIKPQAGYTITQKRPWTQRFVRGMMQIVFGGIVLIGVFVAGRYSLAPSFVRNIPQIAFLPKPQPTPTPTPLPEPTPAPTPLPTAIPTPSQTDTPEQVVQFFLDFAQAGNESGGLAFCEPEYAKRSGTWITANIREYQRLFPGLKEMKFVQTALDESATVLMSFVRRDGQAFSREFKLKKYDGQWRIAAFGF